jgi:hypothetical protein
MTQLRLTEKSIKALKAPHPSGKQALYWDTATAGLGVLVSGTSAIKTFVFKGSVRGRSKAPRLKIERVGLITLDEARRRAQKMMVGFSSGADPRLTKTNGDGVTLREGLETYLKTNLKPRSKQEARVVVERHLASWLDISLWSISRAMVEQRFEAIADEVSQRDKAKAAEEAKRHLRRAERTEISWPQASEAHLARYEAAKKRKPYKGLAIANAVIRCLRAIWNYMDDLLDDTPRWYGAMRSGCRRDGIRSSHASACCGKMTFQPSTALLWDWRTR